MFTKLGNVVLESTVNIAVARQLRKIVLPVTLVILFALGICEFSFAQESIAPTQVRAVAWSNSNQMVALAYQSGDIRIVNLAEAKPPVLLQGHTGPVVTVAWSPDDRFLVSGSTRPDHTLRVWDLQTAEQLYEKSGFGFDILTVAWGPDGNQIIGVAAEGLTSQGNTIVVNVEDQSSSLVSLGVTSDIRWSPNGAYVALANSQGLSIRDAVTLDSIISSLSPAEQHEIVTIAWSPDSTHIAGGAADGEIFVWQVNSRELITQFSGNEYQGSDRFLAWVRGLHFDPSGQELTSISGDGTLRTWSVETGELLAQQVTNPHYAADFSSYGARLVIGLTSETGVPRQQVGKEAQYIADESAQIVFPNLTEDMLKEIALACGISQQNVETFMLDEIQTQLAEFLETTNNVSNDGLLSACATDLIAVANAMR